MRSGRECVRGPGRFAVLLGILVLFTATAWACGGSSETQRTPPTTSTIDPILGDWNVTYGAPAVVTISSAGAAYTVTAKSPVRVTGGSCDLPPGTVIATFSGSGKSYSGRHGLWQMADCSFGQWTALILTLSGNTLNGVFPDFGSHTVQFTKRPASQTPASPR
jgi:hypothetical protein